MIAVIRTVRSRELSLLPAIPSISNFQGESRESIICSERRGLWRYMYHPWKRVCFSYVGYDTCYMLRGRKGGSGRSRCKYSEPASKASSSHRTKILVLIYDITYSSFVSRPINNYCLLKIEIVKFCFSRKILLGTKIRLDRIRSPIMFSY